MALKIGAIDPDRDSGANDILTMDRLLKVLRRCTGRCGIDGRFSLSDLNREIEEEISEVVDFRMVDSDEVKTVRGQMKAMDLVACASGEDKESGDLILGDKGKAMLLAGVPPAREHRRASVVKQQPKLSVYHLDQRQVPPISASLDAHKNEIQRISRELLDLRIESEAFLAQRVQIVDAIDKLELALAGVASRLCAAREGLSSIDQKIGLRGEAVNRLTRRIVELLGADDSS